MAHKLSRMTVEEACRTAHLLSGEQININHEDCPAGEDRRGRLYMKRTEDGSRMLLHCFNCGGSASYKTGLSLIPKPVKPTLESSYGVSTWENAVDLYKGAVSITGDPKQFAVTWPYKYFLEYEENLWMNGHDWYGIRVLPTGTFMTPRGDTGFDYRTTDKRIWRATKLGHEKDSKVLIYNSRNAHKAVIVEDALSAMKVDMCGFAGVALCGSSLSSDDAFKLSMMYDSFVVWLDNDNAEVRKNAELAQHRLLLYTKDVGRVTQMSDPKGYPYYAVKRAIEET